MKPLLHSFPGPMLSHYKQQRKSLACLTQAGGECMGDKLCWHNLNTQWEKFISCGEFWVQLGAHWSERMEWGMKRNHLWLYRSFD